jgi:uncharacterized membrane protein YoaK (UPF0700 family)
LVTTGSVIEIGMRRRLRRIFVAALVVEFFLLLAFTVAGGALLPAGSQEREDADWPTYALIAVAAFAMGAQNTSLRMAGILSVWTTHMTGTLSGGQRRGYRLPPFAVAAAQPAQGARRVLGWQPAG